MHKRSLVSEIGYWKEYTELHGHPDQDFLNRAKLNGNTFVIAKNVTAFKFPSVLRHDSYRERRCDEQAQYVRRIRTEPNFLEREIIDAAVAYEGGKIEMPWRGAKRPRITPPGWDIEQFRRVRGLEARSLAPLTAAQKILQLLYPFTFPIRKIRRAVMRLRQRGS
jgi:hypothetical protein